MYLTRIQLDLTKTKTMQALGGTKIVFTVPLNVQSRREERGTLEIGYPQ